MSGRSPEQFWENAKCDLLSERSDMLNDLATSAFGITEGFDIRRRFPDWQRVYGIEYNNQTIGFGAYMQYLTESGTILYEDLKVVNPEFQGLGVGAALTKKAVTDTLMAFSKPIHVLARTQNGHEFHSLRKGIEQAIERKVAMMPLDVPPSESAQQTLQAYLNLHPPTRGHTDIQTFISWDAYRLRDMTAAFSNGTLDIIDQYLTEYGASKQNGDALFVLAQNI